MRDTFEVLVTTREEAHEAARHGYAHAQALIADGKRVKVQFAEDQDDITIKQRGFLHAAVFPQIAEQYTFPDGTRFVADVWKEHFRKRFLPDKWVMQKAMRWDAATGKMVLAKRATPHRVRQSTEDLGIKGYSDHIDKVIDTAVLELGVVFEFRPGQREGVRYRRPERKAKAQEEVAA